MYLLSTDLHLTDRPEDEYRWTVLDEICQLARQYPVQGVYLLGDVWDRKDRHGATLVNRSVNLLRAIAARAPLTILRGNHDTPLREPTFWDFLNQLDPPIRYVTRPQIIQTAGGALALLPFTPQPKEDWRNIRLREMRAAFMHATVPGAVVENGIRLENPNFPLLPRACKYYSGDVHVPQQVGAVTYVGAPHAIRFGDCYPCRLLLLDQGFDISRQITRTPPRKWMLDVHSLAELEREQVSSGDQVKVRFHGAPADLERWGNAEAAVAAWAARNGVTVAGTEISVTGVQPKGIDPAQTPEAILAAFAAAEGLSQDVLTAGLALLREADSAR